MGAGFSKLCHAKKSPALEKCRCRRCQSHKTTGSCHTRHWRRKQSHRPYQAATCSILQPPIFQPRSSKQHRHRARCRVSIKPSIKDKHHQKSRLKDADEPGPCQRPRKHARFKHDSSKGTAKCDEVKIKSGSHKDERVDNDTDGHTSCNCIPCPHQQCCRCYECPAEKKCKQERKVKADKTKPKFCIKSEFQNPKGKIKIKGSTITIQPSFDQPNHPKFTFFLRNLRPARSTISITGGEPTVVIDQTKKSHHKTDERTKRQLRKQARLNFQDIVSVPTYNPIPGRQQQQEEDYSNKWPPGVAVSPSPFSYTNYTPYYRTNEYDSSGRYINGPSGWGAASSAAPMQYQVGNFDEYALTFAAD
ncbi:hypothetical protein B0T17DRAFT_376774 [Bombardia bombarda]|uniref:Uncharacterized protein n=1 Tax=Bombardia bombarda TaxID=252184 RepID=A0AA39WGN7_9PEZI|nr:hypothetical protein B0T17DRAFT_376774 [Bombardia bombarda]